jgi:hypothetical protein
MFVIGCPLRDAVNAQDDVEGDHVTPPKEPEKIL